MPKYTSDDEFRRDFFNNLFKKKENNNNNNQIEYILDNKNIKLAQKRAYNKTYYNKNKKKDENFNKIWGFSQEMPLKEEEEVEDEAAGDEEEAEGANKDEAGANIFINTYNKLLKDYFN